MKAKDLANKLLEQPEAEVFTTQTMNYESLAHDPVVVFHDGGFYFFMTTRRLGFDIPEKALEKWRAQR